jgi:hypothetical protein
MQQLQQQQQTAMQFKKRPKRNDSDDSDGGYSDNDQGEGYTERNRLEKENQALKFFNECKVEELQELTSASCGASSIEVSC